MRRSVKVEGRICLRLAKYIVCILNELNLKAKMSLERAILFNASDALISALDAKRRAEGKTRAKALRQLIEEYVGDGQGRAVVEPDDAYVDDGQKRAVFFRLSPREVFLAKGAAEDFGGITAWAAGLVRSRLGTKAALVAESERAALVESTAQLKRIGINLNQIAHRLNRDERHRVTAAELEQIKEACGEVKTHSTAVDRLVNEVGSRGEGGDGEI